MMDRYSSFEQLETFEQEGVDYRIRWRIGSSGIAILSIHGGDIEPGTSRIADAIAGSEHTFYSFEGLKNKGNKALHITSSTFDEPTVLEIVCRSEIIVSVHGCAEEEPVVYLGGLDLELRERLAKGLREAGFMVSDEARTRLRGIDQANICNLCDRGMGIQLEISRGTRSRMFKDLTPQGRQNPTTTFYEFAQAVRDVLDPYVKSSGQCVSEGLER